MVNEWTRDDLPGATEVVTAYLMGRGRSTLTTDVLSLPGVYAILDAVMEHLNEHHPKPEPDRWRRAHEIVEQERDQAREQWKKWEHKTSEWKARAEAAEARTAVTREEVYQVVQGVLSTWYDNEDVVDAVCVLFGIEAGQATDPLLDKAQEFAALADWELTDREAELLHTVAAHVLGQEAGDE